MIIGEFQEPTSLLAIELLWLFEVGEILMVGPDFEWKCCAHEVLAPFRKCDHDHEHLSIINFIITFRQVKCFREVSDQFP